MYILQRAFLRERGKNQQWRDVEISSLTLGQVFQRFYDGHLELTISGAGSTIHYVDLLALKSTTVKFYDIPFQDWLGAIGSTALPELPQAPVYATRNILFSDAWQANFKIVKQGTDLVAHKDYINVDHLQHRTLTTVNGFLHRTSPQGEEDLLIHHGGAPRLVTTNHVGMMSFVDIGTVSQLPITHSMIRQTSPKFPLYRGVNIDTGIDCTNKTVMLSIGGYLHFDDNVFDLISVTEGVVRINLNRVDWIKRLFEMRRFLDLSTLGIDVPNIKMGALDTARISTDDFVRKLLLLPQSFVIIVDTPVMYSEQAMTHRPGMVGIYEYPAEPLYPLRSQTGRLIEYWYRNEWGRWVLNVDKNLLHDYLYETGPYQLRNAANETVKKETPGFQPAHLWRLAAINRT